MNPTTNAFPLVALVAFAFAIASPCLAEARRVPSDSDISDAVARLIAEQFAGSPVNGSVLRATEQRIIKLHDPTLKEGSRSWAVLLLLTATQTSVVERSDKKPNIPLTRYYAFQLDYGDTMQRSTPFDFFGGNKEFSTAQKRDDYALALFKDDPPGLESLVFSDPVRKGPPYIEGFGADPPKSVDAPVDPYVPSKPVDPPVDPYDPQGRFSSISRQVEVLKKGGDPDVVTDWDFAKIETELEPGDRVKTAMESYCTISFKDGSTFTMKPESQIQILTTKHDDSKLKLVAGKIWANLKRMFKDGKLEIETTWYASIKGTTVILETDQDHSTLKVIEGSVELVFKADGKKVMVGTGQCATVRKGILSVSSFDVAKETAEWNAVRSGTLPQSGSNLPWLWMGLLFVGAGLAIVVIRRTKKPESA